MATTPERTKKAKATKTADGIGSAKSGNRTCHIISLYMILPHKSAPY